jgi:hypothetical protein
MVSHIDQFGGECDRAKRGLHDGIGIRNKRDNRSVMIRIYVSVQNTGVVDGINHLCETLDRFNLATLTEVWYTLNQSISNCRLPIADWSLS